MVIKKYPNDSSRYGVPLFIKEGSITQFDLNKELRFTISGGATAEEQNNYYTGLYKYADAYKSIENQIIKNTTSTKLDSLKQLLNQVSINYNNYHINWIKKHIASPFSVAVLQLYVYKGSVVNNIRDTSAENLYDLFPIQAIENNYEAILLRSKFAYFSNKYVDNNSYTDTTESVANNLYSKIPNNSKAPYFSIEDTSGKVISLSNFKGKYVLIDFWASWCRPCRINNPALKKIYEKYKGRGLQVLSISMDTDENAWKKAISDDGMNWLQGSDLKGENLGTGLKYGIIAVPQYLLIDPNGIVLVKSIGGNMSKIQPKLNEIFH